MAPDVRRSDNWWTKAKSQWDNVLWVAAAGFLIYYLDVFGTAISDERINIYWFYGGVTFLIVGWLLVGFITIFVYKIKQIPSDDWRKHYPAVFPAITTAFVTGFGCLTMALWPIWSLLTLPILFTLFMAIIILISWLPNW